MPVTKDHILDEIRSTASNNGGVPLGRQRFYKETGIRESDWLGRHWARWSDAIREAGFEPNQLNAAGDESLLLEKYITLTRSLGRFPVTAELRLQRQIDSEFPSHSVWRDRFGVKASLLQRVRTYCNDRLGYEDIVGLYEVFQSQAVKPDVEAHESDSNWGYVYLIKSGRFYKIGKTNAVGRRERELAIQLPERAMTVHVIKTDDPAGVETYWHRRFESNRRNGEWFELTGRDVAAFRRRKFM